MEKSLSLKDRIESFTNKVLLLLSPSYRKLNAMNKRLIYIEEKLKNNHKKTKRDFNVIKSDLNIIFKYLSEGIELHPYGRRESYVLVSDYRFVYDLYKAAIIRYEFAADFIEEEDIVLDISCGYGYGTSYIFKNTQVKKVVGADIFKPAINYANRVFKENNVIEFVHTDITEELSFEEASFDKIISIETLEHVEDDYKATKNLCKWLKKGGLVICTVPNQNVYPLDHDKEPFHYKHYTTAEIKNLLEEVGFTVIDILYENEGEGDIKFNSDNEKMRIVVICKK